MPATRLTEYLNSNEVLYDLSHHPRAFTAQETAAKSHISGREVAKPVMVKLDGRLVMVVVSANERVNSDELKEITGAKNVEIAHEQDFLNLFPECELGAMPPFGNLYGLQVYVSPTIASDRDIAFNAGTHEEIIRMSYRDFERLVQPRVLRRPV